MLGVGNNRKEVATVAPSLDCVPFLCFLIRAMGEGKAEHSFTMVALWLQSAPGDARLYSHKVLKISK